MITDIKVSLNDVQISPDGDLDSPLLVARAFRQGPVKLTIDVEATEGHAAFFSWGPYSTSAFPFVDGKASWSIMLNSPVGGRLEITIAGEETRTRQFDLNTED